MRRALIATVVGAEAGTEAEVELTIERLSEGRWRVEREGGVGCEVDAREIAPGTWSLLLDGRSLVVDLDHQRSALAHVDGHRLELAVHDAQRYRLAQKVGRGAGAATKGEVVRAPIAGKVVKIYVAVGDTVDVGQAVAVLEAMKMENEIRAERGGTVTAIHSEASRSVDNGEPLVTLA